MMRTMTRVPRAAMVGAAGALFGVSVLLVSPCLALAEPQRPADNMPDAPLQGPEGITALSGQVVDLDGNGLPGVELSVGGSRTSSDTSGRFLVTYVPSGVGVLQIDGRHAGAKRDSDYGFYQVRVEARAGRTTVLPYKSWLPRLDHSQDVKLDSPTRSEVVVRTPALPDFELRIPAGVVIRDVDGKIATEVGITVATRGRMPVPVPDRFALSMIPIIQPGGACLYDAQGGIGTATMVFPNVENELPKARADLWRYEPDGNGWAPYGMGTVSADGRQIIPDAGVVITDFASAECDPEKRTRQRLPERLELRRLAPGQQSQQPVPGVVGRP